MPNEAVAVPLPVLLAYAGASVVAFGAFAWDKAAAVRGGGRVPERVLHLLEFLGGWPGALLAIALLRHKSRKASFLAVTFLVALLHAAAWWLLRGRPGGAG